MLLHLLVRRKMSNFVQNFLNSKSAGQKPSFYERIKFEILVYIHYLILLQFEGSLSLNIFDCLAR